MGMSVEEYRKIACKGNKNPKRQLIGRINHGLGENFEWEIEGICKHYELKNLAKIEKTPEPMKILKHIDDGRFESVFTKAAQPDFKGTLKGGRTVVFDAKYTESDRITFQALSDHQRDTLMQYDRLGAISFILVGFGDGSMYKIDINTWSRMKEEFGRKYIKKEELDEISAKVNCKNNIQDFLMIL